MKTIKVLASEIGVTKQAIFQRMKKEPLASGLSDLTTKIDNTVYVYPKGEELIKKQFNKKQSSFNNDDDLNADYRLTEVIQGNLDFLKEQLVRKDRQLDILSLHISIKNRQIENLGKQIKDLNTALICAQEQTKAAQALHAGEIHRGIVTALMCNQENFEKKSFWKKTIKSKNKNTQGQPHLKK